MNTSHSSYPRPYKSRAFASVGPRPIHPLLDPPAHLLDSPPSLPPEAASRRPDSCPIDGYVVSTHLLPAAYPRQAPYVKIHEKILKHDASDSMIERRRSVQDVAELFRDSRLQYRQGKLSEPNTREEDLLWNVVNRYYPTKRKPEGKKGVTLFLSHANGFHKEVSSHRP